jgi:hypothetical protein
MNVRPVSTCSSTLTFFHSFRQRINTPTWMMPHFPKKTGGYYLLFLIIFPPLGY